MLNYRGDVTDLRVVRRVEQHPQSWRVWQPVIVQGHKKRHLIVAFGAMINGKKDIRQMPNRRRNKIRVWTSRILRRFPDHQAQSPGDFRSSMALRTAAFLSQRFRSYFKVLCKNRST